MVNSMIDAMCETTGARRGGLSIGLLLSALLIVAPSSAWAQGESGSSSSSSSGGDAPSESPPSDASASGQGDGAGQGDSSEQSSEANKPDPSDPNYWSKVRGVRTVQKREFQKVGRFAVSAYGGMIPNNIFEQYFPVGLRLNYYILENLGLEVAGSYAFASQTDVEGVLKEGGASGLRLAGIQIAHSNVGVVWSPFYGKVAFYDEAIGYLDMYLFGGAGVVLTKAETDFNQARSEITPSVKPEGVMGAGLAFYFLNHAAIRLDFRQFAFQKTEGVTGVANPSEVSLGFGWFF